MISRAGTLGADLDAKRRSREAKAYDRLVLEYLCEVGTATTPMVAVHSGGHGRKGCEWLARASRALHRLAEGGLVEQVRSSDVRVASTWVAQAGAMINLLERQRAETLVELQQAAETMRLLHGAEQVLLERVASIDAKLVRLRGDTTAATPEAT